MRSFIKVGLVSLILGSFLALPPALPAKTKAKAKAVKLVMHKHGKEKYMVGVPSNWEIREDMKLDLYSISLVCVRPLKPNDAFRENMNVVFENVDPSFQLKEYVNANITSMTKGLGQFKVIETGEMKGGKIPSQYLVYTQVSDQYDGVLKAIVFFYLDGNGRAYSVTCTSTDKSYDAYYPLFLQMGKSFTLPKA